MNGGQHEYVIDPLWHRQLTSLGWQTFIYRLTIDEETDEGRYEIAEETEYQGDDILLWTDDVDEIVSWIADADGLGKLYLP
jgi:hypothetical protein